jgi:hypothetical protein
MEDLTLPSVGASFKKWGCCTSILPKGLAHSPNFPNYYFFLKEKRKEWNHSLTSGGLPPQSAGDRWSLSSPGPLISPGRTDPLIAPIGGNVN